MERAKIDLSDNAQSRLLAPDIKPKISLEIARHDFEMAIEDEIQRIAMTVKSTISRAGILPHQIDAIFMTGGSSLIPAVRRSIVSLMPHAHLFEGDKFGSVAIGLTLSASEKFGTLPAN